MPPCRKQPATLYLSLIFSKKHSKCKPSPAKKQWMIVNYYRDIMCPEVKQWNNKDWEFLMASKLVAKYSYNPTWVRLKYLTVIHLLCTVMTTFHSPFYSNQQNHVTVSTIIITWESFDVLSLWLKYWAIIKDHVGMSHVHICSMHPYSENLPKCEKVHFLVS